jgi:tRNA C32,U32 (ribose-2'-O)-methylase TrmJ
MRRKQLTTVIVLIVVAAAVMTMILSRGWISKRVYMRAGRRLAERLSPEHRAKYEKELEYTLDKFWSCYKQGIISQNDLTDVMDRMKRLGNKEKVEKKEIFEFIGYVSRIYTDAMLESHRRTLDQ